ncbi:MAG: hypothetical protein E6230_20810 [Paenibacillus dendritiformis]|uniref:hypothetical protein n=1 Tax=Paenibacillus dendritiformis TaxID=130049 RepID=UPI00143D7762|nr:hypothetical protein [Paenibacillus dendritiformis]MDU5144615.1 hypothetical protein [Paenibacillus dendritiformis]NKI24641.1 hypothetical protein [Paenibacillus dendritiformis]NRF98355.1 hypothetical protein [Paenibacillus dendritiformis]GIO74356.1 hypothetical protein J27TS7_38700 [Paenibacillus dendritiformis]
MDGRGGGLEPKPALGDDIVGIDTVDSRYASMKSREAAENRPYLQVLATVKGTTPPVTSDDADDAWNRPPGQ